MLKALGFRKSQPFKLTLFYWLPEFMSMMAVKGLFESKFAEVAFAMHAKASRDEMEDLAREFQELIAARNYGRELSIQICPEPADADLLARMRMGGIVVNEEKNNNLFRAIPKRRTIRTQFENKQIPDALASCCQSIACDFGVKLVLIKDITARLNVAELVAEGDRRPFAPILA